MPSLVFKTSAFDHSATPPEGSFPRGSIYALEAHTPMDRMRLAVDERRHHGGDLACDHNLTYVELARFSGLQPLLARHQLLQQRLLIHYLFAKRLDHDIDDCPLKDERGLVEIIDGGLTVPADI